MTYIPKNSLVVIEGLDGSGKSTQIEWLQSKLKQLGQKTQFIHFPMLNQGFYGQMIAEFLRGEYGALDQVHPKIVALLFANDRAEHKQKICDWLDAGYTVLADRYVYSNIAFQCAKCEHPNQALELKKWILDYEYENIKLPRPNFSFYLHLPLDIVQHNLSQNRSGSDRKYLNGMSDIHESDFDFQQKVYLQYQDLLSSQSDLTKIDCMDSLNQFRSIEDIHNELISYFY